MLYRDSIPEKDEVIAKLDFVTNALSRIKSNSKAWRLASVVTSIERVTQEKNTRMYSKFFTDGNPVDFFEWNSRRAKKQQLGAEMLNVVATISRGPIMNSNNINETFDAIVVQLDVNTIAENFSDRFDISNDIITQLTDIANENVSILLS